MKCFPMGFVSSFHRISDSRSHPRSKLSLNYFFLQRGIFINHLHYMIVELDKLLINGDWVPDWAWNAIRNFFVDNFPVYIFSITIRDCSRVVLFLLPFHIV
jgi:hypothetical protein